MIKHFAMASFLVFPLFVGAADVTTPAPQPASQQGQQPPQGVKQTPRQKMAACTKQANDAGLKEEARRQFLLDCLAKP